MCYVGETRHGLSSRLPYGITLAKHNKSVLGVPMFGEILYPPRFAGLTCIRWLLARGSQKQKFRLQVH